MTELIDELRALAQKKSRVSIWTLNGFKYEDAKVTSVGADYATINCKGHTYHVRVAAISTVCV